MKIGIIIGVVVLLIGILWMTFGRGYEVQKPTAGTNIILFGDSLAEGVGSSSGGDVASLLTKRLGQKIINAGVSGNTTAQGLARLERDVLARDPQVVIIILGGNDALQRVPAEETFTNLATIIDRVQAKGAGVILVGIRGGFQNAAYKKRFPDLAEEKGVAYIPDILKGVFSEKELMSDAIHPNDQGYIIFADKIEPEVRMMLE